MPEVLDLSHGDNLSPFLHWDDLANSLDLTDTVDNLSDQAG